MPKQAGVTGQEKHPADGAPSAALRFGAGVRSGSALRYVI